ncbi:MAG TPA: site-specific integrase [Clostridia bacterium]|nr:site-specific integrase [Clostridia bacterium]
MKAKGSESSSTAPAPVSTGEGKVSTGRQTHGATFAKVLDGRKQPIRGLWVRNGRFYAQLKVENPVTGVKKTKRVPLKDKAGNAVATAAQAKEELARLQTQRADNTLPVLSQTPKFKNYVTTYIESISQGEGAKAPDTIGKERSQLGRWADSIGELRLDQVKRVHVNRYIQKRQKDVSNRTVNVEVIALRQVLKKALSDGLILRLPTEGMEPLPTTTPKRPFFNTTELDGLCMAAFDTKKDKKEKDVLLTKNAQQFSDYIRLMSFSGVRRNEALGLQWGDVDFDHQQLFVRRQVKPKGVAPLKNKEARVVDFNPKLQALLLDMQSRRAPDSQWLFPSPQRGDKDIPAKSFRESLEMARTKAGVPGFGFHDCRHHFISMCVMSGIDFMTIAAWVGHKDGGVLIGKVYGHLANEHRKRMADKLNFGGPVLLEVAS